MSCNKMLVPRLLSCRNQETQLPFCCCPSVAAVWFWSGSATLYPNLTHMVWWFSWFWTSPIVEYIEQQWRMQILANFGDWHQNWVPRCYFGFYWELLTCSSLLRCYCLLFITQLKLRMLRNAAHHCGYCALLCKPQHYISSPSCVK